ncbi:MAG: hypothetical protein RIR70_1975 [Pseudomonadota bacterium]|jgi:sugar transferase (PEP-CTERM/EpsH1 system associated)
MSAPPRMVHILWRLAHGGMENGLVNLINHLPRELCRHAIVALDGVSDFAARIERPDVPVIALGKPQGHGVRCYPHMKAVLQKLSPAWVHTRGLAALEMAPLCRFMGLPVIHGEHGWDAHDPNGVRKKYQWLRRFYRPFVTHYIALSYDIEDYLHTRVGVAQQNVTRISNGVDVARFSPAEEGRAPIPGSPFNASGQKVIGTVMRLARVKDPMTLIAAFAHAAQALPSLRLVIVGDGELKENLRARIAAEGLKHRVWLAGAQEDVPTLMRGFDAFVLPSRAEGISNTVLEAMACGLPVIATEVGGNRELVVPEETGLLVPPAHPAMLAQAMVRVMTESVLGRRMGRAGRQRVEREFALQGMVERYAEVYARVGRGG